MTKRKASIALNDDQSTCGDMDRAEGHSESRSMAASRLASEQSNQDDEANNQQQSANELLARNCSSRSVLDGQVRIQPSNNQNDSSSNSSVILNINHTSGGLDESSQQRVKIKKERSDNWSNAEIQVLHREIESRRDIFYGPPSQATKKNRDLAWDAITKEVNAVSTTPRTLSQVMKKFKNEKCRAKRKLVDSDKEQQGENQLVGPGAGDSNLGGNNTDGNIESNSSNNLTRNVRAIHPTNRSDHASNPQHQQLHHHQAHMQMSANVGNPESMSVPQSASINVVKLAPQSLAKTMIDLPNHVQHTIQVPNDDMVLIVPPDMDGILNGVNIVSDGNGQHHFQKCSSSNNQQHGHQGQHVVQSLNNTNQSLMNGTVGGGMMRSIPPSSMCSLVYSSGTEICGSEHQLTNAGQTTLGPGHIAVSTQNLVHHRSHVLDQSQQPQQLLHTSQANHQQQPHHQQSQHSHQHHPQHHPQQVIQPHHQQAQSIHNQNLTPNHLSSTAPSTTTTTNLNGVAIEAQLKNLLFNLLLKDGQLSSVPNSTDPNHDYIKQRNEMLGIIASSLTKIESHLSKLSKVASALMDSNPIIADGLSNQLRGQLQRMANSGPARSTDLARDTSATMTIESDNNNNSFNLPDPGLNSDIASNQRGND